MRADQLEGRTPTRILMLLDGERPELIQHTQELYPKAKISPVMLGHPGDDVDYYFSRLADEVKNAPFDTLVINGHSKRGGPIHLVGGTALTPTYLERLGRHISLAENGSVRLVSCRTAASCPGARSGPLYMKDVGRAFLKRGGMVHASKFLVLNGPAIDRKAAIIYPGVFWAVYKRRIRLYAGSELLRFLAPAVVSSLEVLSSVWGSDNPLERIRSVRVKPGEPAPTCVSRRFRRLVGF